ncbi:ABC transporter permease [Nocardioides sp. J2M5]|uniref:ABC transporter permease n=1 Tax=Nocardioides palaemonis TaxID=2829810 RepID=UPI001BA620A6|nr:ABC transporter permease [Nocardioides palaemonis]MBS2940411.1 ABC transporter permease [Nocardioides palaemonis]
MSGWRPALLIAWRDALRHRGRSALVLVMISLPVLAVTAAAVVLKTAEVSGAEGTERVMGAADARLRTEGRGPVLQGLDPSGGSEWVQLGEMDYDDPPGAADVRAVLGDDVRLVPFSTGWTRARLGERVVGFTTTGVDLSDPVAAGLFDLERGRLPRSPGEVVANPAMLAKGLALGDSFELDGTDLTVVGVGRDATSYDQPVVLGAVADLPTGGDNVRQWLVDGGPVTWSQVRELNRVGVLATSRAVLADPPDLASMAEQMGYDTGQDEVYAVVALIVVMALIEVVLLAGPAFAVGARRHARTLALIAASGGTPAQARRVILASGVVLGLVASGLGLVLGVVVGWALLPLVQRFNGEWFGPFELPAAYLAAIVAFGIVSAVLASAVPAWLASRQDVVAVLGGRRGDRRPRASTPVLGLVLVGIGTAASAYGAATSDDGRGGVWIAAAAVVSVLGMILVVPVVVAAVARLAGRLPLTARYAARDAARHRTRTVPAVAAVAATVAGVVALGIANASDHLENERTYQPQAEIGTGRLSWSPDALPGEEPPDPDVVWDRIEDLVRTTAPGVEMQPLRGMQEIYSEEGYTSTYVETGVDDSGSGLSYCCTTVAVADSAADAGVTGAAAPLVDTALGQGTAVVFADAEPAVADVTLRRDTWRGNASEPEASDEDRLSAQVVPWGPRDGSAPAELVLPTRVADDLGIPVATTSLRLTGDLDEATETRLQETVEGAVAGSYLYVERGYQRPAEAVVVLLVLGVLGGVLMLGGTLTATFLALRRPPRPRDARRGRRGAAHAPAGRGGVRPRGGGGRRAPRRGDRVHPGCRDLAPAHLRDHQRRTGAGAVPRRPLAPDRGHRAGAAAADRRGRRPHRPLPAAAGRAPRLRTDRPRGWVSGDVLVGEAGVSPTRTSPGTQSSTKSQA